MSASASFTALTCLLLAVMGLFSATPANAAEPSFDKVISGSDSRTLSQWGRHYEHGEGVDRDLDRAVRLVTRGPQAKGSAEAHYHLGWLYAAGRGGKRNDELAAASFSKAAQNNDPQAKRMLQRLGYRGKPKRDAGRRGSDGTTRRCQRAGCYGK